MEVYKTSENRIRIQKEHKSIEIVDTGNIIINLGNGVIYRLENDDIGLCLRRIY